MQKGKGQMGRQRFSLPAPEKEREERVKELVTLAEARVRAVRFLKGLKQNFPRTRKIDLLPVTLNQGERIAKGFGKIAAEMLIEEIERNQDLSFEDREYLQQFKNRLQEKKNCPT